MSPDQSHGLAAPDPRYPIGPFTLASDGVPPSPAEFESALDALAQLPQLLRAAVTDLNDQQLATPYRDGGWTIRQLVHHIADSHMTAYLRIRLALTEDWPLINGYNEQAYARLYDSQTAPVDWSLTTLDGLHARLVMVLRSLTPEQLQRGFVHSENGRMTLELTTLAYAWHSRHHLAHITSLRRARGW